MCPKYFKCFLTLFFFSSACKDTETTASSYPSDLSFGGLTGKGGSSPSHMFNGPHHHYSREFSAVIENICRASRFLSSQLSSCFNREENRSHQLLPPMWNISVYCTLRYNLSKVYGSGHYHLLLTAACS